jgi:hypothetical protein
MQNPRKSEQHEKIVRAVDSGIPIMEVATMFHCHFQSVYRILREMKYPIAEQPEPVVQVVPVPRFVARPRVVDRLPKPERTPKPVGKPFSMAAMTCPDPLKPVRLQQVKESWRGKLPV